MMTRRTTQPAQPFNTVQNTDLLVRKYTTPTDELLYAYQPDDTQHVVVADGDNPTTQWVRHVPATFDHPIHGQTFWTIPDNWELRAETTDGETRLFRVPETDTFVKVSVPVDEPVSDAAYEVTDVGDLAVEHVGDVISPRELPEYVEANIHTGDRDEDVVELAERMVAHWNHFEHELERSKGWVLNVGLSDALRWHESPIRVGSGWEVEFTNDPSDVPSETVAFAPVHAFNRFIDDSDLSVSVSFLVNRLQQAGVFPDSHRFKLRVDDSRVGMEYVTRGLVELGGSPAEALDYYMTEVQDLSKTEWASERGVDQSTVSQNTAKMRRRFT